MGLCFYSTVHFLPQECYLCSQCNLCLFPSFFVPIVLHFIFKMFNTSIPGMHNNASPSPGATKKIHFLHLLLISISILHLPNCIIVLWFYVLSLVTSFVATSWSAVALGNNFLNILYGTKFPWLLVSTLHGTTIVALLDDNFRIAIIAE